MADKTLADKCLSCVVSVLPFTLFIFPSSSVVLMEVTELCSEVSGVFCRCGARNLRTTELEDRNVQRKVIATQVSGLEIHMMKNLLVGRKCKYLIEGMIMAKNCFVAKDDGPELSFFSHS